MLAKIYRPAKNAMQSGKAKTKAWLLEFAPEKPKTPDPLMGWNSSRDTKEQIKLWFDTKDKAVAYAQEKSIPFEVYEPEDAAVRPKNYADNFSYYRIIT